MNPHTLLNLILFMGLLCLSALFSASETAFTAVNKLRLKSLLEKGIKSADRLNKLLENPSKLITGILIGNTLVNIAITAFVTPILVTFFRNIGLHNMAIEVGLVTAILTIVILTFGEITPKVIAILYSEQFALRLARPISIFLWLFFPIIYCFEYLIARIYRALGLTGHIKKHIVTEDELRLMMTMGEEAGILERKERQMINSIFEFSKTIVREIMTPRTDAICLDIHTSMPDAIHRFLEIGHSRIPVYDNKIDNILGIVYAKDLLSVSISSEKVTLRNFLREAVFIPETQNIEQLLQQMKKNQFHMAIVMDEYGGVAGLVTLEDIIEEIVGEIQDEYDKNENPNIVQVAPNHYLINAKTNISDLPEELLEEFPENDDYDTIGGFVLYILGKFPQKEEKIRYLNYEITVKEITKRRILKVEIKKMDTI